MKEKIKGIIPYIIIFIVVIIIRTFIVTPVRVNGDSMENTLTEGQMLILNKFDNSFERYDVVVIDESITGSAVIKRIYALPGETVSIENGIVYVNDKKIDDDFRVVTTDDNLEKITLNNNEYFVLGDNREISLDSRVFGSVNIDDIEGTVNIRIFPLNKIGDIN